MARGSELGVTASRSHVRPILKSLSRAAFYYAGVEVAMRVRNRVDWVTGEFGKSGSPVDKRAGQLLVVYARKRVMANGVKADVWKPARSLSGQ